jgi:hypothetical protein
VRIQFLQAAGDAFPFPDGGTGGVLEIGNGAYRRVGAQVLTSWISAETEFQVRYQGRFGLRAGLPVPIRPTSSLLLDASGNHRRREPPPAGTTASGSHRQRLCACARSQRGYPLHHSRHHPVAAIS